MRQARIVERDDLAHAIFRQLGGWPIDILAGDYGYTFSAPALLRELESGVYRNQGRFGKMSRLMFGKDQYVRHRVSSPARPPKSAVAAMNNFKRSRPWRVRSPWPRCGARLPALRQSQPCARPDAWAVRRALSL